MVSLRVVSGPLSDAERSAQVFSGAILVFRDIRSMRALADRASKILDEAFAGLPPLEAHRHLDRADYVERAQALRTFVAKDEEALSLLRRAFAETGMDTAHAFRDRVLLRAQPPGQSHASRETGRLAPHRDTWGSGVMAQTNWWMPVLPVATERTLALYPGYWSRAIANDSAGWNFDEVLERIKNARTRGERLDTPLAPMATEEPNPGSALPIVLEPGDMLCFSGAQLHGSTPNETNLARFNIETRTVTLDDVITGRGALDIDGAAPGVHLEWFRNLDDGRKLDQALPPARGD